MHGNNLNILLVDDDEKLLGTLAKRIELKGYRIFTSVNGRKAMEIANANKIDVAVVDQRLPDMSGLDVIAGLKTLHPHIQTILLTAFGDAKLKEASRALDAAYFDKDDMGNFWDFLLNIPFGKVNILLVDDDEKLLGSLANRIRLKGYDPLTAISGQEAIEIAQTRKLHMAVVDQRLPDMLGLDVITAIKASCPGVQTILLTAFGDAKLQEATRALDAAYFDKDDMGKFWGFIKTVLRKFETTMAAAGMATGGDIEAALKIDSSQKKKKQ